MISREQEKFLEVLADNLGIVTLALQKTGVHRDMYDDWCENIYFIRRVGEIDEISIDYVEEQLIKQIQKGNMNAITFYLKTKGKSRGYV